MALFRQTQKTGFWTCPAKTSSPGSLHALRRPYDKHLKALALATRTIRERTPKIKLGIEFGHLSLAHPDVRKLHFACKGDLPASSQAARPPSNPAPCASLTSRMTCAISPKSKMRIAAGQRS